MNTAATGSPVLGFDKPFTRSPPGRWICQDSTVLDGLLPVTVRPALAALEMGDFAGLSAPERVLAAELQSRGDRNGALSMMVTSMVHMVQAGKTPQSRWKAS